MGALKDLVDSFEKIIYEHGSANILRERLGLIGDKAKTLEDENEKLKYRVTELEDLTRSLAGQLKSKAGAEEYVEHYGVRFKRKPEGGYHKVPYCPCCSLPMSSMENVLPFSCRCGFIANFTGASLSSVVADLA